MSTADPVSAFGATEFDWMTAVHVGQLTPDLLPVVSNPHATISPKSSLKEIGKTPSRYNAAGQVSGFKDWSSYRATPEDIELWRQVPDYGICIQARRVRAIDVDVDDSALAAQIEATISVFMGTLPRRGRANSTKFLLGFSLPGAYTKRVIETRAGRIEFLADGQQFIAHGTHPSGARYEWTNPAIGFAAREPANFEALWAALQAYAAPNAAPGGSGAPVSDLVKNARKLDDTWFEPLPDEQKIAEVRAIAATWSVEQATHRDSWFKCIRSIADAVDRGLEREAGVDIATEFSQRSTGATDDRSAVEAKMFEGGDKPSIYAAAAMAHKFGYRIPPNRSAIPPPPNAMPDALAALVPPELGHGKLMGTAAQQILFEGCCYVEDEVCIVLPTGQRYGHTMFDNHDKYCGRDYLVDSKGNKTESAWECFVQSKLIQFPKVYGACFDPRQPGGAVLERDGLKYVNTWRDLNIRNAPGDVSLFLNHLKKLLPKGDDSLILLSYMAACVQYRGVKAAWCPFIQGTPGNGKSFLSAVMDYCLGEAYTFTPRASKLDGRFNAQLYGKLLVHIEDVFISENKMTVWEALKPMITQPRMEFEGKGTNAVVREVCFNFILNSNHKEGVRKTADDRRICPLFCAQQSKADKRRDGLDKPYFLALWNWFKKDGGAHLLHYLQTFAIPDKYNFATSCIEAPDTSATDEAISAGMGSVEQDVLEAIDFGTVGFKGGWISTHELDVLLHQANKLKMLSQFRRRGLLRGLDYDWHPGLPEGKAPNPINGHKTRLYVKDGHAASKLTGMAVVDAYLIAQSVDGVPIPAPPVPNSPPVPRSVPPPPLGLGLGRQPLPPGTIQAGPGVAPPPVVVRR